MAANLFGESGLNWGLDSETGILVQSYEGAITGNEKTALNHEGEAAGVSYYNPVRDHTIEGYITGSTGIAAAEFGSALTIANVASGGGVSAGLVVCNGVTNRLQNEDYEMITATARQFPLITT